MYKNLPPGTEIIAVEVGNYKESGDISLKDKIMIDTNLTEKQFYKWLSEIKPAAKIRLPEFDYTRP